MINYYNPLGKVSLTNDYFEGLVAGALTGCYGVVGTAASDTADGVMSFILGEKLAPRGVTVRAEDNRLVIDLHIKILYGINVDAICDNIRERVTYAVEDSTNLKIKKRDISIDDIITE